jgi:hypothetical protein
MIGVGVPCVSPALLAWPHWDMHRLMEACAQRSSLHFYAVDVAGNTYSNGSKKATAVR